MITPDNVAHLAKLAHLCFNEAELKTYAKDLGSIFEYAHSLNKIDTRGIAPSAHAIPIKNVFREDIVVPFDSDTLLDSAPEKEGHAFKVPKILVD